MSIILCRLRTLTTAQELEARRRAIEINPEAIERFDEMTGHSRGLPRRLALVIQRRWPHDVALLTVQFLDIKKKDLKARILSHMNAWGQAISIRFEETSDVGLVRLARMKEPENMAGYWSYVGTEILGVDKDEPTMNLEGFTMRTSESEFRRVVRHEAGHTLGFDHEHLRSNLVKKIDRNKAFAYYRDTNNWTREDTIAQVLTPLSQASLMGTAETDPLSIMCYHVPAEITKDGEAIPGGVDINERDYAFAATVYPKVKPRLADTAPPRELEPARVVASQSPNYPLSPSVSLLSRERGDDADTLHIVVMDTAAGIAVGAPSAAPSSDATALPQFARVFASYGGARVTNLMRLRRAQKGDAPTRFGRIIGIHEKIESYTNRERGSLPDDDQMVEFGIDLFETLFEGDVRRLYDEARARRQGRKLDIVFTSMIPWIAEKPWEFSYDPTRKSFLATEEIHFIRNVMTAVPSDVVPQHAGPLRILVASAQPVGFGLLSIEQEQQVIQRGFESLVQSGLAEIEVVARASPSDIHSRLATGRFNIVHFIGHGTFDERTQQGALIFQDERGGPHALDERSVREIFCQRGVSLVFFNSCQSGSGGRADFNKGVAQALVARGLPALVANQYSVLDASATTFAKHFYWSLAHGMDIGQASREARIAVNYSMHGEPIDWAVPVVYARRPDMTFCALPATSRSYSDAVVRHRNKRAGPERLIRVAAWDMDNVFPSLDSTLKRMNEVQSAFSFERADLSAPIDAWDVDERAPDGKPYLHAEKLAERLQRATFDLRVDILACLTRHWLRDEETLNLYAWWPNEKRPPVIVLSCAGFDELLSAGPDTDRAIVNTAVAALTGYLASMGSHAHGPKTCPMFYNENRSLAHLIGHQSFDKDCEAKLKKKIPTQLPALEALLKAFG